MIASYLGYDTRRIEIPDTFDGEMDILMSPAAVELENVVVTAEYENPADRIMRKVIAKKIESRKKLRSYKAKAFTRSKVENDTSLVSLAESSTIIFWDSESGTHEEFIAKKQSEQLFYLTDMNVGSKNIYNFCDDNISIVNFEFIGPTNPEAFDYYDFKVIDQIYMGGKIVYSIRITPKTDLHPLFEGVVYVLLDESVIVEADIQTAGGFGYHEFLREFHGKYQQKYSNFGREFWFPVDSRTDERAIMDMGILYFPRAIFKKTSIISNYEVNVEVKPDIARLNKKSEPGEKKPDKEVSDFSQYEKLPLTEEESRLYENPDTELTIVKTFKPGGAMAPFLIQREDEIEEALRTTGEYSAIDLKSKLKYSGWLNRVEGFNLGVKYSRDLMQNIKAKISGSYQTAAEKFSVEAEMNYFMDTRQPEKLFFLKIFNGVDTRYSSNSYNRMYASLLPVAGEPDYFDYFHNEYVSTGLSYGIEPLKTTFALELSSQYNSSLDMKYNCNFFDQGYRQRLNPEIDDGRLNSIKFKAEFDENIMADFYEKKFGGQKTNRISFQAEHSSDALFGSEFDYTKFDLQSQYVFATFFQDRPDYNYLKVKIIGSTFIGDLPMQKFSALDGVLYGFSPLGVFKSQYNRPLTGEKTAALFWEYNFTSIPFEIIGLDYFAKHKYEFLLHGAAGRSWIRESSLQRLSAYYNPLYFTEVKQELGFSVNMKYKFIGVRLDATRCLNTGDDYLGFTMSLISFSI